MNITVKNAKQSWQSPDGKVTIWEITDQDGTIHQTMSKAIAEGIGNDFEIEEYTNPKGKKYIRQPKTEQTSFGSRDKQFRADPIKQESIEWQACLKAAVETVRDFHTLTGSKPKDLVAYKLDVVNTLVTYTQAIGKKPDHTIEIKDDTTVEDLPPVENYEDLKVELEGVA